MAQVQVPPHSLEAEESVVGAILLDQAVLDRCPELKPGDFYRQNHKLVMEACVSLHREGASIDLVSVADALRTGGNLEAVGGSAYLAELIDRVPTAAHAEQHAEIVRRYSTARQVAERSGSIVSRIMLGSIDLEREVPEECALMSELAVGVRRRATLQEELVGLAKEQESVADGETRLGISTGFADLDRIVGGWFPGDYTLIAARPSVGKTALMLALAIRLLMAGVRVGIVSAEMKTRALLKRMVAQIATIDASALRYGTLPEADYVKFASALDEISAWPLDVIDGIREWYQIEGHVRRMCRDGCQVVFVDHLRAINVENRSRETRERIVAEVSGRVFGITRDFPVAMAVLQQVNREVEKRPDPRPLKSDLRDTGALEEDADNIWMPYYAHDDNSQASPHEFEVIVRKNRNGKKDTVRLHHDRVTQAFDDMPLQGTLGQADWTDEESAA